MRSFENLKIFELFGIFLKKQIFRPVFAKKYPISCINGVYTVNIPTNHPPTLWVGNSSE